MANDFVSFCTWHWWLCAEHFSQNRDTSETQIPSLRFLAQHRQCIFKTVICTIIDLDYSFAEIHLLHLPSEYFLISTQSAFLCFHRVFCHSFSVTLKVHEFGISANYEQRLTILGDCMALTSLISKENQSCHIFIWQRKQKKAYKLLF